MSEIGIVGSGVRAETLAFLAKRAGVQAWLWSPKGHEPDEEDLHGAVQTDKMSEVAQKARLVFMAVPSWELREVSRSLGDHLKGSHRLIHTVHGLEIASGALPTQVLREETPVKQTGVLINSFWGSDNLEVQPGAAVVGSRFPDVIRETQGMLASPIFRVYGNKDLTGVEVAVVSSNLIAVAVGLADGLNLGAGARGTLFARGISEVSRIVKAYGGKPETASGMAGLGRLAAQTSGDGGVEYCLGMGLAAGHSAEDLAREFGAPARELIGASKCIYEKLQHDSVQTHIVEAVHRLLVEGEHVANVVQNVFALAQMME